MRRLSCLCPSARRPYRPFFRSLPDRLPKPTGVSARSPIGPLSRPETQRGCVPPSPPYSARVGCGVAPSPPKSGGGRRLSCLCPRRPPAAPTSARSPIGSPNPLGFSLAPRSAPSLAQRHRRLRRWRARFLPTKAFSARQQRRGMSGALHFLSPLRHSGYQQSCGDCNAGDPVYFGAAKNKASLHQSVGKSNQISTSASPPFGMAT